MNRANRPRLSRISGSSYASRSLSRAGDGSTLSLDFTTGVLDPRLTFTRAGGGTYVGPDGYIYGIDSATSSSLAIGTGSKSVTLTATADVNRRFEVGQKVYFSNGANNMSGLVTAYSPSTQVITINATSTSGSGSFTSWFVGNASARFDYDPSTLTPRGLLIEGSAATLNSYSEDFSNAYWTKVAISVSAASVAGPDNVSTATRRIVESGTTDQHCLRKGITTTAGNTYTVSVYVKPGSYDTFGFEFYWNFNYNGKAEVTSISGNTATVTSASGVNATLSRTVMTASGWYRYALTFTHPPGVTGTITPDFNIAIKQTNPYAGNGTNYMDVYGFMLEAGSGASSYIPTGASTGSRALDFAVISGSNFTPWFTGGTSGTFYADWYGGVRSVASTVRSVLATTDLTTRHLHMFQISAAGALRVADFNGTNSATTGNSLTSGARTKGAFSFAYPGSGTTSTVNVCLNGGTVASSATMAFSVAPTFITFGLPSSNGTTSSAPDVVLNNSIRSIKYWPTVLSNAQLQDLTT